ncbi:MAG: membrane dipeptidase [Acidobacteria bacterium]|nr:membrane dipeptidase [Acidobacteriota bacterium]
MMGLQRGARTGFLALLVSSAAIASDADRARQIHFDAIVVDTHADSILRVVDNGEDLGVRTTRGDVDIPRMKQGGLDCEFFSIWPAKDFATYGFLKRALDIIDGYYGFVGRYAADLDAVRTVADIRAAVAKGKIATLMGVEGGHAIEDDVHAVSILARLGVRYMTLTWSFSTSWAGSSGDSGGGLSPLGKEVVREMNRVGMAVDISHVSDKTFWDVLATTTKPPIASHSSCRALASHRRNMTDDMLRALAAKGGVVGINFYPRFLDDGVAKEMSALEARLAERFKQIDAQSPDNPTRAWLAKTDIERAECRKIRRVTIARLADHIAHAVQVAGIDHVGLGSDFDGIDAEVEGLEDCSKLPELTAELLRRGFSEQDVRKILGENYLRVFKEIIGE